MYFFHSMNGQLVDRLEIEPDSSGVSMDGWMEGSSPLETHMGVRTVLVAKHDIVLHDEAPLCNYTKSERALADLRWVEQ